jgi:hypothetical protein
VHGVGTQSITDDDVSKTVFYLKPPAQYLGSPELFSDPNYGSSMRGNEAVITTAKGLPQKIVRLRAVE